MKILPGHDLRVSERNHDLIDNFLDTDGAAQKSEAEGWWVTWQKEAAIEAIQFCSAKTPGHGRHIVHISVRYKYQPRNSSQANSLTVLVPMKPWSFLRPYSRTYLCLLVHALTEGRGAYFDYGHPKLPPDPR